MSDPQHFLHYLLPWEFSAAWAFTCLVSLCLYARGVQLRAVRGVRTGFFRQLAFVVGVVAVYGVTQTYYDYLSQFMFFTHRIQHLVLHHAAPLLIALSAPWSVLAEGCPEAFKRVPGRRTLARALSPLYRWVQHPLVAPVLFVGLIYYWLTPEVHFDAMLSRPLYEVMNWSMFLDGLLFWWLMLDPRSRAEGGLPYGWRLVILIAIMPPQIVLGAYITFSETVLFDVYDVCGRAWPLSPLEDQRIGGLFTWIPAAMMSVPACLVVLRYIFKESREHASTSRSAAA